MLPRVAGAAMSLLATACGSETTPAQPRSAAAVLQVPAAAVAGPTVTRTVYVPIYSSIYQGLGIRREQVDLTATLSIRNVSAHHPIVVAFVRYYDSRGTLLREYVVQPGSLAPLATVEFVIDRNDTAGGPGANFLVQWTGPADVDEPLLEAVMIGGAGNAGISFTSQGRVVRDPPAAAPPASTPPR
jgi:Protein of unknown function (DUF3124)